MVSNQNVIYLGILKENRQTEVRLNITCLRLSHTIREYQIGACNYKTDIKMIYKLSRSKVT
jgi:hypothetical protein